jgi:hypothetical protein
MDYKVALWWNRLKNEEQDVLLEMLYEMSTELYEQHGVFINNNGEYYKEKDDA